MTRCPSVRRWDFEAITHRLRGLLRKTKNEAKASLLVDESAWQPSARSRIPRSTNTARMTPDSIKLDLWRYAVKFALCNLSSARHRTDARHRMRKGSLVTNASPRGCTPTSICNRQLRSEALIPISPCLSGKTFNKVDGKKCSAWRQ